ncbi:DHA2 family efflux MFS transporter permease subunit [Roseomonas sp. PWR1]|uniref:DHA2 family efflux MFS transporter permease subunit n=1 Tax=Roseomonas nitratireducens TaxID=2820810 RepID=A0ABS4ANE2_9PROT|nr:DHA2 family efflux MFS transporter permease subunit [Neoroseomonas nitratireducens]MBP0462734.1 DHA2 family efflux MFS transporter permease subunit [Neoroseomonas nitratireducens]
MKDHRGVALIVASALFMQNLDSAVLATALPSMARDLNEDPARLGAAITAYLVSLTVFIPFSAWIADRFGAKRVFMLAIMVFVAASLLCGRADGLGELVAFRVLQGVGGAMMVPVGRLLLLRGVEKRDMLSAMAWLTMPALLGPVTGPPLGGLLTDLFSWRAVFWINVPIGLIGVVLVAWKIPHVAPARPGPPDVMGLVLTGVALAALMFGLETVGRHVVPGWMSWTGLALGLVAGALAVRHCRRVPQPAVDLSLFRIATFRDPAVAGSLFRTGAGAVPFLIPVMLQIGFGMSATESGFVSFATALGAFAMKPLVRPLLRRTGFRAALLANRVLAAAGIAALALLTPAWPGVAIFLLLAAGGLARSLQFTALNTLAFADVPTERMSRATALYGTLQQLTPALGVVLATTTLEASLALHGRDGLAVADFSTGFLVAAVVVLASIPLHARLAPDAGAEVSGHRR